MAVRFQTSAANYQSRSSDLLDYNSTYTWMAWCYLASDLDANQVVFFIRNADASQSDFVGTITSGVDLVAAVNGGSGSTQATWTVGQTRHVCLRRSSSSSLDLIVDGVLIGSDTTAAGTSRTLTAMESGSVLSGALARWDGHKFAEKAWSASLSIDEIAKEMWTIRPQRTANLYAFWPGIANTASAAATDFSGNGRSWTNNGTISVEDPGAGVGWGASPLFVNNPAAGPAVEIYGFQGDAFQFGQYLASAASGINGTLDTSFANFTVSATGKVEIRGTGANNAITNVTASGLGKVEIEGVGANNTIANVTAAGLGTVLVQGTGANNTIGAVTSTATGTVLVQGTGANNTIGEFTLAGIGSIGAAISGTLDKTIDAVTASATGTVLVQGTGANNTIGAVTVSGTGKVEIQGTGANNTIAAVTAAGLGTVRIAGTGANNTIGAVTVSATGSVDIAGTLSSTIGPITVAAIGSVENRGTLDVTVGAVTLAGSGVVGNFVSGQLNKSIGIFTVTATAGVQNTVRSMGATIKQGTFNGSVHAKPYSKSRFRQESMKWPSRG